MKLLGCSVCKRMLPRKVFSSSQMGKQGMVGQLMKNFAKQAIKKKGKLLRKDVSCCAARFLMNCDTSVE